MKNVSELDIVDNHPGRGDGLLRVKEILGPNGLLPMSKSTWYAGVKSGRYPQPVKIGPRMTAWRKVDIYALVDKGAV